jgi:hypothetical protein
MVRLQDETRIDEWKSMLVTELVYLARVLKRTQPEIVVVVGLFIDWHRGSLSVYGAGSLPKGCCFCILMQLVFLTGV